MSSTDTTATTTDLPPVPPVRALDFVTIPTQDRERARRFYGETLGLRRDEHSEDEFWIGSTCLAIWDPTTAGREFAPQRNGHLALQVDDVAATKAALEARGIVFGGEPFDTGVCHMVMFSDPDGNDLLLHHRHTPVGG
jgi:catechol 2,3-dioxygenase-like lactoylglutathione lyase family enzyme